MLKAAKALHNKTHKYSRRFVYLEHRSNVIGETNDCTVKALAVICDISYDEAHEALAFYGRKVNRGAYVRQISRAAKDYGFQLIYIDNFIPEMLESYPLNKRPKQLTTYHPIRYRTYWLGQPTLLLSCAEHIVAFKNGEVHDWSAHSPVRIKKVYRVIKG